MLVFGPALEPLGALELGVAAAAAGASPTMTGLAVSRDGARLYVAAGSSSAGGYLGPPQHLLIVDVARRALVRAVALDDYGPAGV